MEYVYLSATSNQPERQRISLKGSELLQIEIGNEASYFTCRSYITKRKLSLAQVS